MGAFSCSGGVFGQIVFLFGRFFSCLISCAFHNLIQKCVMVYSSVAFPEA
ncbi:hypothetical protein NRI_0074 [Neorickettsia risticii str. Illinois]|uniref:Uncharacterized protein n=1 Tax=Neorickettsia risticii (strain Illinois) TaxID=434131 RepID=C6V3V6_NEORI|nr:hypothetical protein NRI_0074 [Neorickettsia risticii str. Illinois]